MNSAMRPILNESFVEKEVCESGEQCTGPTGKATTATEMHLKHLKKKNANAEANNQYPNRYSVSFSDAEGTKFI